MKLGELIKVVNDDIFVCDHGYMIVADKYKGDVVFDELTVEGIHCRRAGELLVRVRPDIVAGYNSLERAQMDGYKTAYENILYKTYEDPETGATEVCFAEHVGW